MDYMKKLESLIEKQYGTISSSDLDRNKIPRIYLRKLVLQNKIERIDRGIYISKDKIVDDAYFMQKKYPQIIFSHETALYLHGLSDMLPLKHSATVPNGYKAVGLAYTNLKIYYIQKNYHSLGVETKNTLYGNPISIYNIEKTICDTVKGRSRIEIQIITDALKRFSKMETVDLTKTMEYANKLKVDKILMKYLEVLL